VAERSGDDEFLRRVTLDLLGRVPSVDELVAFRADTGENKRELLVRSMQASPQWAAYWAEVYSTLLVGQDLNEAQGARPLREWLEEGLEEGKGWDEMADAMISATGPISSNPAGAFVGSNLKGGGPEAIAGAASRKFLGVQIECAQCHDHPYAQFEREEFWGMAAFFARTKVRRSEATRKARKKAMWDQAEDMSQMAEGAAKKGKKAKGGKKRDFEVFEKPRGELKIKPKDDKGREADEAVRISPAFMGEPVSNPDDRPRRELFSERMRQSPLFAQAAVGFAWTKLMGRGLSERWDDLDLDAKKIPVILDLLSQEFIAHDYDLRWLQARIVASQAYQRSSRGADGGRLKAESAFARASLRPLSSDQLFRSLLQATRLEDTKGKGFQRAVRQRRKKALAEYAFAFNDDEMGEAEVFSGNVPQALLLFNGALTNQAVLRRAGNTTDRLLEIEDDEARAQFAYRSIFARDATREELDLTAELIASAGGGASAWEDLLFAMINSTEFSTNH
jgi:hypothetical protein